MSHLKLNLAALAGVLLLAVAPARAQDGGALLDLLVKKGIVSNQEDQHTIQIISFPGGKILWRYGHVYRKGSAPGYLNTPDDAYLLRMQAYCARLAAEYKQTVVKAFVEPLERGVA